MALSVAAAAACGQGERVTVPGQEVPLRDRAQLLAPMESDAPLALSIALQPRDRAGLDALVRDLYDPASPGFERYLTAQEFAGRFGASDAQIQTVSAFLQGNGLTVTGVAKNHLLIKASGSAGAAQRAFGVSLNRYLLPSGREAFANAAAPSVPAEVAPLVASISGLDDTQRWHPVSAASEASPVPRGSGPALGRQIGGEEEPAPEVAHPHVTCVGTPAAGDGFAPGNLVVAYDMTSLSPGLDGTGVSVALVEYDAFPTNDPACYFQGFGITAPAINVVNVAGGVAAPGAGAIEVDGDIELLGGIAPGATIEVYEAPGSGATGVEPYNQIVSDDDVSIVSTSWGLCEQDTGVSVLKALDVVFEEGAAEGITFFAAAGDTGAYGCDNDGDGVSGVLGVESPASDPFVTGVGGTALALQAGAYEGEDVWGDTSGTGFCGQTVTDPKNPAGGGGGGFSSQFILPTFQVAPGVANTSCPTGGMRQVPDVTANASSQTPDAIYCSVTAAGCKTAKPWGGFAGTSAAAPTWGGAMALINQYRKSQSEPPLGWANPALYSTFTAKSGAGFHDIVTGDNFYYPATTGYDMASGLGSPDVSVLAPELPAVAVTPPTPTPTPTPSATPTPTPTPTPSSSKKTALSCEVGAGGGAAGGAMRSVASLLGLAGLAGATLRRRRREGR